MLTRLSLVLPMATTYAVVGLLAQVMFNQKYGVVNQMLAGSASAPVNWIGDTTNAFIAVVIVGTSGSGRRSSRWSCWPACRWSRPRSRRRRGSKPRPWWTVLRYVQLPFLLPSLVAVLILRTADTLKLFDMVFTMTRGGPGLGDRVHRRPDRARRQPAVRHRHGLGAGDHPAGRSPSCSRASTSASSTGRSR